MDAAKKAVEKLVYTMRDDMLLCFRAYGHQSKRDAHNCEDTAILVPFGRLEDVRDRIVSRCRTLSARGYTPIRYVLELASHDFPPDIKGRRMIILVSDGKETCEGDPCALAAALAAGEINLVIHTVGFGADSATKSQLQCVAEATGGRYFGASDTDELAAVLGQAVETHAVIRYRKKGPGRLQLQDADLRGHVVTDAETGMQAGHLSHVQSTIELPAGIYHVTVGGLIWKSIRVLAGETTVLRPGRIQVENASLKGHTILEMETGIEQGMISSLHQVLTLIPGQYEVTFGPLTWPVAVKAGETSILNPGTVTVEYADYRGHTIRDSKGQEIDYVSQTRNWTPLPPRRLLD